ncbi:MAG: hypothetical protein HGA36_04290 [Candidatus Moranbacteria bacterium]|nr:hypothetical protein [Candidatus Moranbacteria bacterium]
MEIIGGILLLAIFVLPFLTFASSRKDIYVDGLKSGVESGTAANPYHTISEALKHANNRTDVHVAKGEYKDNIEIPKGVKIFGSGQGEVVITAKNDRKVVVSMKDNTEINKLTIQEGREGVWIKEDARVSIIKCTIKDNRKDGINIASGSTKKADAVSITDSTIKNNGRSGIFSQKRRLVLINNEVIENDSDGADFAAGTSAWIEDNKFNDNDGSGLKLNFDNSNIWTKGNDYRDNKHSGLEVNAFGGAGRIDINKSNFIENKNFGIARIARGNVSINVWEGLTVQSNTTFEMTKIGKISSIIQVR